MLGKGNSSCLVRRKYSIFRKGNSLKKGGKREQAEKKGSIDKVDEGVDEESKKIFESKKSESSSSVDDKYNETVRRMLNSGEVSPIMRKVLEKEMRKIEERAQSSKKASEAVSGVKKSEFWKESESKGSAAAKGDGKGSQQEPSFTEQTLKQGENAIKELERELEDGTIPPFLRPLAQQLLDKLRSLQESVQDGLQDEKKSNEQSKNKASEQESNEQSKNETSKQESNEQTKNKASEQESKNSADERPENSNGEENSNMPNRDASDFNIWSIVSSLQLLHFIAHTSSSLVLYVTSLS